MIDVHCHIIHGVDDGPSTIEQSLRMVEEAEKLGIRVIIATPHYQEDVFELERVEENYQELLLKSRDYGVAIKMGYEVFLNPFNPVFAKNSKRLTLNRTGRMLFEFPFDSKPAYCFEAINRLQLQNIVPIIAHPERNRNFLNNFGELVNFIKAGCLIQVDAASIAGVYGMRVKEFTKHLIKMNFVDMVASNAHYANDYTNWYMEAYKNVAQWADQYYTHRLFYLNAKNMLDGTEKKLHNIIG
jgi:protein-tyrosine phosphatase